MFELKKAKKSLSLAAMVLGAFSIPMVMVPSSLNAKAMQKADIVTLPAEDTRFEIDNDGRLTKYEGTAKEVTIPDKVKSIGFGVFMGRKEIEKIILPENLELIDEYAFYSCTSLKEINIPDSVKTINRLAFGNCEACEKVNLGKSLALLEKFVFLGCKNLKEINASPKSENFSSYNGLLYNKNRSELVLCPMGKESKNLEICKNTKSIASYAFLDCKNLEQVFKHGSNAVSVYDAAFSGCENLKKISFINKIDLIGPCAFMKCKSLEEFLIGEKVKSIGDCAFLGCSSLKKIVSKAKDVKMGHKVFESCPQTILVHMIKNSDLVKYVLNHADHLILA